MNTIDQDIVIVGAGPTGLSLGAELYRQGHQALIFDKQAAGMIPQDRVEAILSRRLQSLGGGVERSGELTHMQPHGNYVDVHLNGSGTARTIRAIGLSAAMAATA